MFSQRLHRWSRPWSSQFVSLESMAQPFCEYRAINIDAIVLTHLKGGILVRDLPTRSVQLPVDDISKIAVLSWRWDFDHKERSRNLASAVKYARSVDIRYLFADIISLDQSLDPLDLIQQVLAFSVLYKQYRSSLHTTKCKGTLIESCSDRGSSVKPDYFSKIPLKLYMLVITGKAPVPMSARSVYFSPA
jgi:hypothetical protein